MAGETKTIRMAKKGSLSEAEASYKRAAAEAELYLPVKEWLEQKNYIVKGEVNGCDIAAWREGEIWPVVVELKKRFNLSLFLQAMERKSITPYVYVAAERAEGRGAFAISEVRRLCLQLGLGLLTVKLYRRKPAFVEMHCEPLAEAKKPGRRTQKLRTEFLERSGDYNVGGVGGRKLVTAYREKALLCADALAQHGQLAPRQVRDLIGSDRAAAILRDNVYGWFSRVERGVYTLSPGGVAALTEYAEIIEQLQLRKRQ